MYYGYNVSDYTAKLAAQAEEDCREVFKKIDENALICSAKVLSAFQECRVSTADFIEITGYGYTDSGRDKLEEIYAKVFGAEDALVRPQIMSGTHALAITLGGLLKHGDTLLYISGEPYDTLRSVIGTAGESRNSLIKCGVKYEEKANGTVLKILEDGTLEVDCFVYPERITEKTKDAKYEFELSPDAMEILPYGVAGDLLKSDVSAEYGTIYSTEYKEMIQRLDPRYQMTSIYIEGGVL